MRKTATVVKFIVRPSWLRLSAVMYVVGVILTLRGDDILKTPAQVRQPMTDHELRQNMEASSVLVTAAVIGSIGTKQAKTWPRALACAIIATHSAFGYGANVAERSLRNS